MKLEKCALCGRNPRRFVDALNDHAGCGNRRCLMEPFGTMDRRFWNRFQRAIRKARRPGKVPQTRGGSYLFKAGIAWACARLVDYSDRPTLARDLWREAGYERVDLEGLDSADRIPLEKALPKVREAEGVR